MNPALSSVSARRPMGYWVFALAMLFLGSAAAFAQPIQSLAFTDTSEDIANPERGFAFLPDPTSPLSLGDLDLYRTELPQTTVIFRNVLMDDFLDAPLSAAFLADLTAEFALLRQEGMKTVLRFSYSGFDFPPPLDVSPSRLQSHLDALGPVVSANRDVIMVVQAGFLGRYGEWFGGESGTFYPSEDTPARDAAFAAIAAAMPADMPLQLRTPRYKRYLLDELATLPPEDAFDGSVRARTGFHNDCFLAGPTDVGTFVDSVGTSAGDDDRSYLAEETRYVSMAGELCAADTPRFTCPTAETELADYHFSILNAQWYGVFDASQMVQAWENNAGACYGTIRRRLGYRFELATATFPTDVAPGGRFPAQILIDNDGYAAPVNSRPVQLILRPRAGGEPWVVSLPEDVRRWAPGVIDLDYDLGVRAGMPEGTYDLLLHLPDPRLSDLAAYAIRIPSASQGQDVWEPTTGMNVLGTVEIDAGTAGPPAPGALWFEPSGLAASEFSITTAGAYLLSPALDGFTVDDLAAINLVAGVPGYSPSRATNLYTTVDGNGRFTVGLGAGDVLPLGRGFRWILSGADRDYGGGSISRPFPATLSTTTPNTADVTLDLQTAQRGINIYGNPFGVPLDISGIATWPNGTKISRNVFTWEVATKRWVYDAGLTEIAPWQAFFVRTRPGRTGTVTIPASAAVGSAAWAAASENAAPTAEDDFGFLRFDLDGRALDGAPLSDGAFALTVGDDAEAEPKLAPLSNAYVAASFTSADGLRAIEALRADGGSVDLPVAIQTVGAERELTLRWDAPSALPTAWRVTLVDLSTGATADLSKTGSYAFESDSAPTARAVPDGVGVLAADGSSRFVIRIEADGGAAKAETELSLSTPQPNPVRGSTRVPFTLAEAGTVRLSVIDALGREVAVLADGSLEAGMHTATFDGSGLASGVYLIRLETAASIPLARRFIMAR